MSFFSKKLKQQNNSFTQFIPWDYLVNDFTIMNKNNGFQRTFRIKNHDLNYFTEDEIRVKLKQYNRALKRLPDNFMIHYEVQRKKTDGYITKNLEGCPFPVQVIDKLREEEFSKDNYYKCEYYITVTYLMETDMNERMLDLLSTKSTDKEENMEKQFTEKYNYFNEKCIEFIEMLKYVAIEIELLQKDELMGYLHSTVNPEFVERKKSPDVSLGFPLDEYLSHSSFEFGKNCKINDYYLKTVSVMKFPEAVNPLFFHEIEELDFEFRMSTRYVFLTEEETKKTILNAWRFHQSKQKNEAQWLYEGITKKSSGSLDEVEVEKTHESREALKEFREGGISYGYYTFTIILWDKNLKSREDKVRKIMAVLIKHDFEGGEDRFNVKDSFIGAIPGEIKHNIRRYTLNTFLLTGLMPNSTLYQGEKTNSHLNDIPLITAKTQKNDVFYMNLHVHDSGHAMLTGETGTGKSVAIGNYCQAFSKYKNAQIFIFDYKGSSRVLTACMGGKYYDLGEDGNLKFQPLATIETAVGKNFANNWILTLLELENMTITPEIKETVWRALTTLEKSPVERRTLTSFMTAVSDFDVKRAIKQYTISGAYGMYFDGDKDSFSSERWQVFEMDHVLKDERVVPLLMMYLFHKIEVERLIHGYPTLIVTDEAGVLFRNIRQMSRKFDDWLVTLRKLNASLMFAMQNLNQIKDNPIYSAMKGSCKTKIFLPDQNAMNEDLYRLYQDVGLNSIEIKKLSESERRKEYIIKNEFGTSKFEFTLSPLELAFVASTGINDQIKIKEIQQETNDVKEINLKWIEYKFGKHSDEYNYVKKIIGGN